MSKSSFEKAIEKYQKEAKRQAQKDARAQTAAAIVNGQPFIGDMRIMDASSEELLKIILSVYDGNENRKLHGNDSIIPTAYHSSIHLELEKLKMYGVISNYNYYINAIWEVTLAPQGITYFEDKAKAEKKRLRNNQV